MLIKSENIFLDVKGKTKYDIIKNMINSSTIEDGLKEYAYEKVKEREELQPTSVGNGIGIAHAKIEKISELGILVGVLKKDEIGIIELLTKVVEVSKSNSEAKRLIQDSIVTGKQIGRAHV